MVEKRLDHVRSATLVVVGAFVVSYLATTVVLWANDDLFRSQSLMFHYVELVYVAGAVFLVLAADCAASSGRERRRVVVGIGAMGLGACAMAALPYLGLEPSYDAPARFLLPEGLTSSQSGGLAVYNWSVERSLGSRTCFFGYELLRAKSLFTYPTLYAAAMAMVAPLQLYLARRSRRGVWRLLWGTGAALSVAGLVLATARTALAALVLAGGLAALGWAAWAFFTRQANLRRLLLGLLGVLCAAAVFLTVGPWAAGAVASAAGLKECEQGGNNVAANVAARESLV